MQQNGQFLFAFTKLENVKYHKPAYFAVEVGNMAIV